MANTVEILTLSDLAVMIQNVSKDVKDVGEQVKSELKSDLDCLRKEIDAKLANAVHATTTEMTNLSKRQDLLEGRVERLDRLSHSSDLLVNGIPIIDGENLMDYYNKICNAISFMARDYTLLSIFRLKLKNRNPTIILKFISPQAKNEFYYRYLKFKKLSLCHLGFETDIRVYINESLTTANSECFKFALQLRKKGLLHNVYSHNGFVYVKKSIECNPIKIDNMVQLKTFDGYDEVNSNHKRKPSSEPDRTSVRLPNDTKIFKSATTTDKSISSGSKTPAGSKPNPFSHRTSALATSNNLATNGKSPIKTLDKFFEKKTTSNSIIEL